MISRDGYSGKNIRDDRLTIQKSTRSLRLVVAAFDDAGRAVHPRFKDPDTPIPRPAAISRPFLVGLVNRHLFCLLRGFGDQCRIVDFFAYRFGAAVFVHVSTIIARSPTRKEARRLKHTTVIPAKAAVRKLKTPSFRGVGAAREPGSHERRALKTLAKTVFMVSGPDPMGRPGMTACYFEPIS